MVAKAIEGKSEATFQSNETLVLERTPAMGKHLDMKLSFLLLLFLIGCGSDVDIPEEGQSQERAIPPPVMVVPIKEEQ